MNAIELDQAYTHLCRAMTEIGRERAEHFLARFAVLALSRELTFERAQRLIEDAAVSLHGAEAAPLVK